MGIFLDRYFPGLRRLGNFLMKLDLQDAILILGRAYVDVVGQAELPFEGLV